MADLRYMNTSDPSDTVHASQNGMFLYGDDGQRTINATDEVLVGGNAPLAGAGPLSDHHVGHIEESNTNGKLLAGLIVALMVGAAGVYAYTTSGPAPAKIAHKEEPAQRAEIPTTPAPQRQAAADETVFTPSESTGAPLAAPAAPVTAPASTAPRMTMKASASTTPARRPAVRTARMAAPAATANETEARANAITQATNQSLAENATRSSLPLTTQPDSMTTVQPTAPTTAPTLPSAQPTAPAPVTTAPAEPAPAAPVQ